MSRYIIGITGASGAMYGIRLIEELLKREHEIHILITNSGKEVIEYETGYSGSNLQEHFKSFSEKIIFHDINNLFASIASGSYKVHGMIILPCSMSALAGIATGVSMNLLGRAADVCIKEGRRLIIVPRETPLNSIHLKNMLTLSDMGVTILPAMPGFYHKPESIEDIIDFLIGKIFDVLNIENDLFKKWGN
jgi:flavin prenyltransferase